MFGMEGKLFLLVHDTWDRHTTSVKWTTEESLRERTAEKEE